MNKAIKKPAMAITTLAETEKAMLELNHIDRKLTGFVLQEEQDVSEARRKYHQGPLAVRKAELERDKKETEKSLEKFAEEDKKSWPGKSKETAGGTFGFRRSPHSVVLVASIAKKTETALLNLQTTYQQFIRRIPTINKELILQRFMEKKLDIEKLHECGLKVKQKESFFIKTNSAEALEKAQDKLKKA